jgi:hypothetical protein
MQIAYSAPCAAWLHPPKHPTHAVAVPQRQLTKLSAVTVYAPHRSIIAYLAKYGTVLTEHVGLESLKSSGEVRLRDAHPTPPPANDLGPCGIQP